MLSFVAQLLILSPLLMLAHELGHALVGLSRTDGLVRVLIGRPPARWQARTGRFVLAVNPIPVLWGEAGRAGTFAQMQPRDRFAYAIAGPMAQTAASVAVVLAGLDLHMTTLLFIGGCGVFGAVWNLAPFTTRGGLHSDGSIAAEAWRAMRAPLPRGEVDLELDATFARWYVSFTDPARMNELRTYVLGATPGLVGYAPGDRSPEAAATRRLADAGWCWREAERGDTRCIRDAALDAVHRATLTGLVEPKLTALAAAYLAKSTDLGLGSPGSDDGARRRFLWAGLAKLPAELRPPTVPLKRQHDAFVYGIALHDVESARSV
jgi:hypothetical protein